MTEEILTIKEAAELLKLPVSSVYKLVEEGKIPGQKIGRHWRFHRTTLLNWVATEQIGNLKFENKESGGIDFI
jgi:excisionase family DNA binding protein